VAEAVQAANEVRRPSDAVLIPRRSR
jgi:hypothetical protein